MGGVRQRFDGEASKGCGHEGDGILGAAKRTALRGGIFFVFVTLYFIVPIRAEPPDGYYDTAVGKLGSSLKKALHRIVDGHKPLPYTVKGNTDWHDGQDTDVWEALTYTDSGCPDDMPKCGKIRLLYLDETRDLVQAYRGGPGGCQDLWEREHVWPTSRKFKKKSQDGYTDLHHIRPADKDINNSHNNYGYNVGGDDVFDKSKGDYIAVYPSPAVSRACS